VSKLGRTTSETEVISVPNALGSSVEDIETFYAHVEAVRLVDQYTLDMRKVEFVKPYGIIAIISAARRLSELSGRPIWLNNLDGQVHRYLERMDIFDFGQDWLQPLSSPGEEWARSRQTPNLLELTVVTGPEDVTAVTSRAERIFSRWLRIPDLRNLLNVLSELCANVYQHSGDPNGCVLIQKYEVVSRNEALVCLAVGDLGCGIRGSLITRHGEIGHEPLDYIREAMRGRTARSTGRGGIGLRLVEQIVGSEGGYLWLRSETAAVLSRGPGKMRGHRSLIDIPGTQVAVELHAPLPV
jgi:anti-sigma regulatory factor (Ser/Thr protein kinase)